MSSQPQPRFTKLSIVIPAFCEEKSIETLLSRVYRVETPIPKEVIVVDDASTDETCRILKNLQQKYPDLKLAFHAANFGKGAALRTGFGMVTGDLVVIQDADLEYNPADYGILLKPILNGRADVVYGSRFLGKGRRVRHFWHYVGNRMITLVSNMFSNLNLNDMETCYKAFDARILPQLHLKSNRFGFEPEFTVKIAKLKCRVHEVPISYDGRTYDEGKKITWRDGVAAVWHLFRFRFLER